MNSSATEVLETYSTRSNVGGRKVGDAAPKQFDYSDSSSGEEEEFDMDFTSNPKTPPAASVAKKRQHLLVDSSDSSDSEDLRPRKKGYSKYKTLGKGNQKENPYSRYKTPEDER